MPRWPEGYVPNKWKTCPKCGGKKDYYATACRKCSTPKKPLLGRRGSNHPAWKGGAMLDKDGYVKTYAPDHPFPRRGGYVREHVRVMELHIGRRLLATEVVHHKDGNRLNNSLENLELMSASAHSQLHRSKDIGNRTRNSNGTFARKDRTNA